MINVIFDMDGTLLNSAKAIAGAVNEIREKKFFLPKLSEKFIFECVNSVGRNWALELYNINEINDKSFKEGFEEFFIKHYNSSNLLFDGVLNVLDFLRENEAFMAIATNAAASSVGEILKKQNIAHYFNEIVGVDDKMKPKPNPQMLNLLRNAGKFEKTIFVGDSQKDEEAAKNANMIFLKAKWGEKINAKNEFNDINTLLNLIKEQI